MFPQRNLRRMISILVILATMFSSAPGKFASAQGGDRLRWEVNSQTGKVSFIGPENGSMLSASNVLGVASAPPAEAALAFAKQYGPAFGLQDPERDLVVSKTSQGDRGRIAVHYQQNYQGIPIMGGELIVNTDENGDLYSMNGEVSPDLSLPTQPAIDPRQASQTALRAVAKWYRKAPEDFLVSAPALWIYD